MRHTFKSQRLKTKNQIKDLINTGYASPRSEKQMLSKLGLTKDTSLSNGKDKVYVDKKGKASVVYKGTNPLDPRDLLTDAALLVGLEKYTPRFQNAKKLADKAKQKYGTNNVSGVGHSLGGSLAESSGLKERYTYNKGVGLGGIGKQMRRGEHDYRAPNDIVSVLAKTQSYKNKNGGKSGSEIITTKSQAADPLSAHNLNSFV